jgi:two-component system sensor histidine kinase PilS (NtrC family)
LESRLKWLMFGRLAIALVSIGAMLLTESARPGYPPYPTLVIACLLNLVYLIAAQAGVALRPLAVIQLLLDVALLGFLVYLTGIDRFFAYLYLPAVIAAAMIAGPRMAMAMASTAVIVLAGVSTLYFLAGEPYGLNLPLVDRANIQSHTSRLSFLLPYLFFFGLALHVAAFLVGRLTAEARHVRILTDEILQNMAGGVLAADRFGGVQFVNAQAARLLGLKDPETLRGRQIHEVFPEAVAALLHRAISTGERQLREVNVKDLPLSLAVSCLSEGSGGAVRGVVAIVNDLSLRIRVEEMTRRAERFHALLEMSAGMAHEIRNPLASIRGAAQELSSSRLPRDEDRLLLDVVMRESDRLNQIIGDFLEYASDRPMEMTLFDLTDVIRETALLLQARPADRSVKIVTELPREMLCRGEPDKFKQVFLNLGLNALDACTGNGRAGTIVFRCSERRGFEGDPREGVLAEVVDTGCGIPRENLARVFDPFFTTKAQGTGMGLSIARKIVQGHGGDISLVSEEGKGTTARVWLPS